MIYLFFISTALSEASLLCQCNDSTKGFKTIKEWKAFYKITRFLITSQQRSMMFGKMAEARLTSDNKQFYLFEFNLKNHGKLDSELKNQFVEKIEFYEAYLKEEKWSGQVICYKNESHGALLLIAENDNVIPDYSTYLSVRNMRWRTEIYIALANRLLLLQRLGWTVSALDIHFIIFPISTQMRLFSFHNMHALRAVVFFDWICHPLSPFEKRENTRGGLSYLPLYNLRACVANRYWSSWALLEFITNAEEKRASDPNTDQIELKKEERKVKKLKRYLELNMKSTMLPTLPEISIFMKTLFPQKRWMKTHGSFTKNLPLLTEEQDE